MSTQWICIYKTNSLFEAEALKGNLELNGLTPVIMNKRDSSYLAFGYVEVHVPEDQQQEARQIIAQQQTQE